MTWPEPIRTWAYNTFIRRSLESYGMTRGTRYYPWLLRAPCGCRLTCEKLKCGDERVTMDLCKEHD